MNIIWFRQDLRVNDNPALVQAVSAGDVLPIYIFDDINAGEDKMGATSRVWLHHALIDLNSSLEGHLTLFEGDAKAVIQQLCDDNHVDAIFLNRCYEPWQITRDKAIKDTLVKRGVSVKSFNGSLLWEPWHTLKKDGTPYKVFTPFYRRGCLGAVSPRIPLEKPKEIAFANSKTESKMVEQLGLLPILSWDKKIVQQWSISEQGAERALTTFLEQGVFDYKEGRNFPNRAKTSRLSPYLHFGQISPNQIWHQSLNRKQNEQLDTFQSELGWREFSYSLLYHFPHLPRKNLQTKFDRFPWQWGGEKLMAWQQGQTGYPIVDAGMRELWQTGFMHNRVRMIVGSFLVKNLLLHWQQGEAWFWDCLVDADLASNSASWQWIAGCGADAAPYFRVFNPVAQGEKFDKEGEYTRRFVPELRSLPDKYLFRPWDAPAEVLQQAGVRLGVTYPQPIIDLKTSREEALAAFKTLKLISEQA
jgi:deoxyribodipyrimidine photo-lyase